tara:strand:+ start:135102 stop:135368 length:267 start_codon:yes stop_codon:yes gene_type:complete
MAFKQPKKTHKIGRLNRRKGTETRAILQEFDDGRAVLDVRQWYKKESMEKFAPTAKGMVIPVQELRKFRKVLDKAIKVAEEEDLMEDD